MQIRWDISYHGPNKMQRVDKALLKSRFCNGKVHKLNEYHFCDGDDVNDSFPTQIFILLMEFMLFISCHVISIFTLISIEVVLLYVATFA